VLLHRGRCWNHVGRMGRCRSSLLLAVQHPKIRVVRMGQRSLLVLHILRIHHGRHHHAAVSVLLGQDYCPGERREVVVPGLTGQREGISQGRDSSESRDRLVELWQSCCHHCGMKTKTVQ
jgi:hypothetical protein